MENVERQQNYTIMEGHELPSEGKVYDGVKVNPHIELRSMTARDEMKRLGSSSTEFKTLADIIESCMIEKPAIHVYDMTLADYEYLLHKLRVITYGHDYKMVVKCNHCNEVFEHVANLDLLMVKDFDQAIFDELQTFVLPDNGDTIKIKPQTPRILDEIVARNRASKKQAKQAEMDFTTLYQLKFAIDEVNGIKQDPISLENYINRLSGKDMMKILNNLDKINRCYGIDNTIFVDCPECGGEIETFFRLGQEFFRPTTI